MEVLTQVDEDLMRDLLARDRFFWLDLQCGQDHDIRHAGELLGLHHLALEDSLEFNQRPKLDLYGRTALLVVFGVQDACPIEVHAHLSGGWLMTVRDGHCMELEAVDPRDAQSEEELVGRVLDALVDSFVPPLDAMDAEVDDLQESLLRTPTLQERQRLLDHRTSLIRLRQRALPMRDLLADRRALVEALPGFETDEEHHWLTDVHDHLVAVVQRIDALEAILSSSLQLHLAMVAAEQNEVTRRLTVVATIFLPLSVVVGFFGMNFGWLVEHVDTLLAFLVYGIGGMALSTAGLLWYVRRLQRASP